MLVIEGKSKSKVGNFANKIKKFRLPDIYKGKGIWYKNEVKIFKEIKKTDFFPIPHFLLERMEFQGDSVTFAAQRKDGKIGMFKSIRANFW